MSKKAQKNTFCKPFSFEILDKISVLLRSMCQYVTLFFFTLYYRYTMQHLNPVHSYIRRPQKPQSLSNETHYPKCDDQKISFGRLPARIFTLRQCVYIHPYNIIYIRTPNVRNIA